MALPRIIYYHSIKQRREGTIPFPEMIAITLASENDLRILKNEYVTYLKGKTVFEDKIYSGFSFCNEENQVAY